MQRLYQTFHTHKVSVLMFLSVGAVAALVNFGSFAVMWKIFKLHYQVAVSIAYVLSVIVHFTANRNLTFKSYGNNIYQQLSKYLIMVITNYLVTLGVVKMVVEEWHLSPYIGIICAIGATVGTGYLMARFWVFKIAK